LGGGGGKKKHGDTGKEQKFEPEKNFHHEVWGGDQTRGGKKKNIGNVGKVERTLAGGGVGVCSSSVVVKGKGGTVRGKREEKWGLKGPREPGKKQKTHRKDREKRRLPIEPRCQTTFEGSKTGLGKKKGRKNGLP